MLRKCVQLLLLVCISQLPLASLRVVRQEPKIHHGHHGELEHIGKSVQHFEIYAPGHGHEKYKFMYSVHDPHTGDEKSQQESLEDKKITGSYWLIQPDGKKRTVTYHADETGFHANVEYSEHHQHHGNPQHHHHVTHVVHHHHRPESEKAPEIKPIVVAEVNEVVDEKPIEKKAEEKKPKEPKEEEQKTRRSRPERKENRKEKKE